KAVRENMSKLIKCKLTAYSIVLLMLFSFAAYFLASLVSSAQTKFSGFVYAEPGVPVANAMVVASGPNGHGYAITNSMGQYLISEGIPTGTYTVRVFAQGYINAERENVQVVTGQEVSGINFYLSKSGGISGKVTDATSGAPLKNIMVVASSSDGEYGWYGLTDANGDYSIISNLDTGIYEVTVVFPEGYIMKSIEGVSVIAGSEVKDVNFALERSGIISGKVFAVPSGVPLGNATVTAASQDGKYYGYAITNATGHYRISSGLGTGTYIVMAIYGMNFGQAMGINVIAGLETSNVDIPITVAPPPPSGIITGKVTDKSGDPIANAQVSASGPAGHGEARTDQDGNYVISSGLGTGVYTVTASAPGYTTESVSGVSVTVGQVTPNINFQLSPLPPAQSGRISGTVNGDENPIPEFQNPLVILLGTASAAIVFAKLLNAKAKRHQAT
ncbi:MAG: carboxypeptidase-like regulatory domain-containing protein, partial [Candidatus Bathyarchaeia archaeon]